MKDVTGLLFVLLGVSFGFLVYAWWPPEYATGLGGWRDHHWPGAIRKLFFLFLTLLILSFGSCLSSSSERPEPKLRPDLKAGEIEKKPADSFGSRGEYGRHLGWLAAGTIFCGIFIFARRYKD